MADEQTFQDTRENARAVGASERLSSQYNFVRSRQLEGTYPGDAETGVWPITCNRVSFGWGSVTDGDCPRTMSREIWPPPEPPGLDAKAKTMRSHHYQRVRSASECCVLLYHMLPVSAAFEITEQWFSAQNGVIRMPRPDGPIVGSHCIRIVEFDVRLGFVFVNSWSEKWGNQGFGLLPFEYFDKYLVSAWARHAVGPSSDSMGCKGTITMAWGQFDPLGTLAHGGQVMHGSEVYDATNDERIGWAFAVHRDGFLDVEELFVRPQYRARGHGTQLVEMLLKLAAKLKRPLRLWVPFADWTPSNIPLVERIAEKLGLRLFHADVRWASALALDPAALPPAHQTEVECRET